MTSSNPKKDRHARPTSAVSAVLADGRLVETVISSRSGLTSFLVGQGDAWSYVKEVTLPSGSKVIPISMSNNLIRHEAVLFASEPEEYGDDDQLIGEIESYIHRYVDLSPTFERIAARYALLTWVFDAFNELPYLRFIGDFGSGKTRALLIIGGICYKSFTASGASTVSPIFHVLDTFGGTLVLDEADFRFSDEKAQLTKILNNGNTRGMPVLRTMASADGKEFNPRAFNVFGPKIVASRGPFQDRALESRFISEEMGLRPLREDVPISLPKTQKDEALTLRNKLLLYRLRMRHLMYVDEGLADPGLEPRFNQILVPLLTVTDDPALQAAMRLHVRGAQNDLTVDRAQSTDGQVVALLASFLPELDRRSVAITELVERFTQRHGAELDRPMSPKLMGWIVRHRLGLKTYRLSGVYYASLGDRRALSILFRRYGLPEDAATAAGSSPEDAAVGEKPPSGATKS